MTIGEYIQLKAFARTDGALLALVWTVSFALYVAGMANQSALMMAGTVIAVGSPFFAAMRLRKFRDHALGGIISFRRAYAYTALTFFYSALLFALVQFVYFQFIDKGYLANQMAQVLSDSQTRTLLQQSGLTATMDEAMKTIESIRPIDFAINYLTLNIIIGLALGLPIAAITQSGRRDNSIQQQ